MKKIKTGLCSIILMIGIMSFAQNEEEAELIADAENAKYELLSANTEIQHFFDNSVGYVIFPNVGKGGLIIGGASGNGILYENGIANGRTNLKKMNIGLQAGGQAIIEAIFFESENDLNEFKKGDYEFSAEASAIALKSGKAINAKFKNGLVVFTMPKAGLMADISVGGQKFSYSGFADTE